jgi:hypothetical protein
MIMSSSLCLTSISGMSNTTHFETPSKDTLHANLICESHLVRPSLSNSSKQTYIDHYKFYDIFESWLEEYFTPTFHMNNNTAKFDPLSGNLLESILSIFHPSFLQSPQLNFNEHMIVGLELLD